LFVVATNADLRGVFNSTFAVSSRFRELTATRRSHWQMKSGKRPKLLVVAGLGYILERIDK
jgi:hypothetical protein